jgi:hypothetical protein
VSLAASDGSLKTPLPTNPVAGNRFGCLRHCADSSRLRWAMLMNYRAVSRPYPQSVVAFDEFEEPCQALLFADDPVVLSCVLCAFEFPATEG